MRKRNVHIQFWMNEDEAKRFNSFVQRSGLSREAYLRCLISGYVPTDLPPPDYYAMMHELRTIGVNMNQIAKKAHALHTLDAERYDEAFVLLKQSLVEIVNAVTAPRKIERN